MIAEALIEGLKIATAFWIWAVILFSLLATITLLVFGAGWLYKKWRTM